MGRKKLRWVTFTNRFDNHKLIWLVSNINLMLNDSENIHGIIHFCLNLIATKAFITRRWKKPEQMFSGGKGGRSPPIGDSKFLFRCSQNGKACFSLILLADVVSVGSRVVRYHDGLIVAAVLMYSVVCVEADMLVLVDLFNCPVECGAQTVGGIASTLGKTNC